MDSLIQKLTEGLSKHEDIEALLLFGSVSHRNYDKYSDLDFLVIVKENVLFQYIADLKWLDECARVLVFFREGADSFKVLFENGIVGDFGVVTEKHFGEYPHEEGVIVFKKESIDLATSNRKMLPTIRTLEEWMNHFLFNLYLGLGRYLRGEKISSHSLIEGEAMTAFLHLIQDPARSYNPFQIERHFEEIHPSSDVNFIECFSGLVDLPICASRMFQKVKSLYTINPEFNTIIQQRLHDCGVL